MHAFLFPVFGEWLSYNVSQDHLQYHGYMIHLLCIFYSKNKFLLTWSSWLCHYGSLNFLEKSKLCYISFYTGKILRTFFVLIFLFAESAIFVSEILHRRVENKDGCQNCIESGIAKKREKKVIKRNKLQILE